LKFVAVAILGCLFRFTAFASISMTQAVKTIWTFENVWQRPYAMEQDIDNNPQLPAHMRF
jgi:hypothetical protein